MKLLTDTIYMPEARQLQNQIIGRKWGTECAQDVINLTFGPSLRTSFSIVLSNGLPQTMDWLGCSVENYYMQERGSFTGGAPEKIDKNMYLPLIN